MKITSFKKALVVLSILVTVGKTGLVVAHSGGGYIDVNGNNAGATDLAQVNCTGDTAYLFGQIKDMSPPVNGLLLSFHIYKGIQMATSTDTVSGDGNYSEGIKLKGGPGAYYISATKTNAGARLFDVIWHCMSANDDHTQTDITVLQMQ